MLYTQSFWVATITVVPVGLSSTSGCAYTWPLTLAAKMAPNLLESATVAGDSAGSLLSHPSRDRLTALVFTLARDGPDPASWIPARVPATATAAAVRQAATRMRDLLGKGAGRPPRIARHRSHTGR